ncbi:MAG: glycosyltransferase [bacterium]
MIYDTISIFLIVGISIGLAYALLMLAVLLRDRLFRRNSGRPQTSPAITVFKPLKGLDDSLAENLRSFFRLDYPRFELLFGVADAADPAVAVVRKLQAEHPQVESRLVISERAAGLNPKVNNLANLCRRAQYDVFVISDSNVLVRPGYLHDLICQLEKPGVGLVTSTIRAVGARSLGSALENLHNNTFIAGSVHALKRIFQINVTIGKSMCFRRETIRRIGGFEAFADYLAEDHLLGVAIREQGMRVELTNESIDSINRDWRVSMFWNRHLRWAMMRRHLNIGHFFAEILSNPVFFAVLLLVWRQDDFSGNLLIGTVTGKLALDLAMAWTMGASRKLKHVMLSPIKDLMIAGLWLVPFFSRVINWRGNLMLIGRNTTLSPIEGRLLWHYLPTFRKVSRAAADAGRWTLDGTRRMLTRLGR